MIIELTGIPGAGKSTIIKLISELELRYPLILSVEKYIKNKFFIKLPGTIGFDIILLLNFYKLKKKDYILLSKSLSILINGNNLVKHKINIFRNIFKKLVMNRFIQNKKDIFLVDEGLSHIPMSLFVDINSHIVKNEVIDFLKKLPKIDNILLIDTDDFTLIKRVIKRGKGGHKRIDFSQKKKVTQFISKSRVILDILTQQFNPTVYLNTNPNPDIESIIKFIEIRNV